MFLDGFDLLKQLWSYDDLSVSLSIYETVAWATEVKMCKIHL